MLACCVGARLWHSTMAEQEFLLQHIICITFGQPFMKIKILEEEIGICPKFENTIYSVFSKVDNVPLMFSYLNLDESQPPPAPSSVSYPKSKALVGPSDAVENVSTQRQTKAVCLFALCIYKLFHVCYIRVASSVCHMLRFFFKTLLYCRTIGLHRLGYTASISC